MKELLKNLISSKTFYKMYKEWCEETGEKPLKKKTLLEYFITKNLLKKEVISFKNSEGNRVKKKCYKF